MVFLSIFFVLYGNKGRGQEGSTRFFSLWGKKGRCSVTRGSSPPPSHHRCLRSALYIAKPSTAHTVAPRLALSQKVEFFRSA